MKNGKIGAYELNQIYTGDARELAEDLPNESIDLIFTDPPYSKKYFYLYEWLGSIANRVLKPNGFLLTYCGPYWKDKIINILGVNMEYFYDYIEINGGDSTVLWPKRTISRYKSILAYRKKESKGLPVTNVIGAIQGSGASKEYHKWGQSPDTADYYIDVFTSAGQIILDPFMGGGTTAVVCKNKNLHYLGFEIDGAAVETAKKRIDGFILPTKNNQLELDMA